MHFQNVSELIIIPIADMYWYSSSRGSDADFINWNVWNKMACLVSHY